MLVMVCRSTSPLRYCTCTVLDVSDVGEKIRAPHAALAAFKVESSRNSKRYRWRTVGGQSWPHFVLVCLSLGRDDAFVPGQGIFACSRVQGWSGGTVAQSSRHCNWLALSLSKKKPIFNFKKKQLMFLMTETVFSPFIIPWWAVQADIVIRYQW